MYRKGFKNEFYTRKAKEEGYPARSVYKLKEIDEKYKIFKKGDKVLDLGAAPGSWLLYISNKIGERGKVIGIDIEEIKIPKKNNIIFLKKDVFSLTGDDFREKFDVLVADLSPKTSGVKSVDVAKSLELSKKALEIAKEFSKEGGSFICKVFEGEGSSEFLKQTSASFEFAKRFKPKAVRKESKEFYIAAKGFAR